MASPNQPDNSDGSDDSDGSDGWAPQVIRLRIAPWDAIFTLAALGALLMVVSMTSWPSRLFGFADNVCVGEDCAPVPFGVDYYIFPLMWGGIGAAVSAAVIGPFVSMVKGWYMSFWPIISVGVLTLSSIAGAALTGFSERYWH